LLEETPDLERALNRGATLFGLAARLIGSDPPLLLAPAGRLYAAGALRRLGLVPSACWAVTPSGSVPVGFRRLTGLAVLAKRDLRRPEAEGTPGRAWALLRHRLTGRFPR
jgi:15-cis-phytoene synthase